MDSIDYYPYNGQTCKALCDGHTSSDRCTVKEHNGDYKFNNWEDCCNTASKRQAVNGRACERDATCRIVDTSDSDRKGVESYNTICGPSNRACWSGYSKKCSKCNIGVPPGTGCTTTTTPAPCGFGNFTVRDANGVQKGCKDTFCKMVQGTKDLLPKDSQNSNLISSDYAICDYGLPCRLDDVNCNKVTYDNGVTYYGCKPFWCNCA